jgi:hypothetical protein
LNFINSNISMLSAKSGVMYASFLVKVICLILIVQCCKPSDENIQEVERWTSSDPLSFSYRLRSQKYLKGNLIENPSFEEGKIKIEDSIILQEKINGWEIVGKDVKWVCLSESSFSENSDIVHKGTHSILINRKHADETESLGQGVLSGYIKVIPGNYTFSLYLNLKDIKNPKSRFGTKIYDAVDIRVLFYDRNKLQIAGEQYSTYYNQKINSSFKGYSFANFENIDSTGWLHVIGRSQLFPFPDGDLPDETKFVRIFIGLKGTGKLWADDISFVYNNQNFNLEERLEKYFDTTYTKSRLLIPQPRKVEVLESKVYFWPDQNKKLPIILIPSNADPLTEYASKKLERTILDKLIELGKIDKSQEPSLIRNTDNFELKNAAIVFSLGKTELFNKYKKSLPLEKIKRHNQGYFIYSTNFLENVVFIHGNTPEANYYAVQSLMQLFDNKRLLFHNANIIDYPSHSIRSLLLTDFKAGALKNLYSSNTIRFNAIYYRYGKEAENIGNELNQPPVGMNVYFDVNEKNAGSYSEISNYIFNSNSNNTIYLFSTLLSKKVDLKEAMYQYYLESGNKNDFSGLLSELEGTKAKKDFDLELMLSESGNLDFNSNTCGQDELNTSKLNLDKTKYVWSGYGLQSWQIDEADLFRAREYFSSKPVFMDFTMYPRSASMNYFANDSIAPYKLKTACLFEAYDNNVVKEVYKKSKKNITVYKCADILDRIRLKTASDFYWNMENYNPEFSLFKALVDEFGFDASRRIIKFNVIYFKAKSELIMAATKKNLPRHARRAIQLLEELKKTEKELKTGNYNSSVNEVISIFAELIKELEGEKDKLNYTPLFR